MKITKRQMRRIIKEEMAHPQSGLGKSITDAEFPIVVSYEDRSEIAYNQDDLDDILNDIGPRGIEYSLDSLEDMEPSARPVGGSIEQLGESMKITRKQLRRIIRESMYNQMQGVDDQIAQVATELISNPGSAGTLVDTFEPAIQLRNYQESMEGGRRIDSFLDKIEDALKAQGVDNVAAIKFADSFLKFR